VEYAVPSKFPFVELAEHRALDDSLRQRPPDPRAIGRSHDGRKRKPLPG